MASVKCQVCSKMVFAMEKLSAEGKHFHKSCFKCSMCKGQLSLGKYASMDFKYFCKPCFKKTFFLKGNYSEGFGKLKPQQQWALSMGLHSSDQGEEVIHDLIKILDSQFKLSDSEKAEANALVAKNVDELKAIYADLLNQEKELDAKLAAA